VGHEVIVSGGQINRAITTIHHNPIAPLGRRVRAPVE
jgi:hypothetical protein